jgi:arginyl-tRNA synthetase
VRDIQGRVEDQLRAAAAAALGDRYSDVDPLVRPADPRHGDYQANLALSLARVAQRKPREIAEAVVAELRAATGEGVVVERAEVAGPGFINLTLNPGAIEGAARHMLDDARLDVPEPERAQKVVVDYGGANLAKEMHIGHLRSSIIGDAIVRVLGFAGHDVVRQNHIGDWGTQFGMLLEHLIDSGWNPEEDHSLSDLNALYQAAKLRFDQDAGFAQRSRDRVVRLQSGDEQSLSFWRKLIDESCSHMNEVFQRLGVLLRNEDLRGESFYNSRLAKLVEDLRARGVLEESDGAQVVFCQGFKTKSGDPLPLIVQKSDDGQHRPVVVPLVKRFRIGGLGERVADRCQHDKQGEGICRDEPPKERLPLAAAGQAVAKGDSGSTRYLHD